MDSLDLLELSPEQILLRQSVRSFVKREVEPQAAAFNREERFNLELFRKLGPLGLLGITVPEEYGGSGLDPLAAVIAHEELSASDPGFCLSFLAHSMLCANNLAINASEGQSTKWLPKLCSGEWIGAMGMTEPGAGTDVLGMSTRATKVEGGYRITGRKMWVTNGTIDLGKTTCDCILLYAKTGIDPNGRVQLSSFVVEGGTSGFSVGQKINDKLGMRSSNTAELCFDDCFVAEENRIGPEGAALVHMMRNLEIERLTLAAMSLGIARRSLEIMVKYSGERTAFGKKLHQFGQIQRHIADSFAEYHAAKSYVYLTAARLKLNQAGQRLHSDGVKLFAARTAKEIADRAIQVLGGYGYVGEYVVERLWRDARLLEIGGGTNEAHQKNITGDLLR